LPSSGSFSANPVFLNGRDGETQQSLPSPSLHRFALLTAASTLCLIIAGALVVGNQAGLAVPDWPLSFGTWMPPMEGGVFYEHGHRMVATSVGVLTVVLALWIWRRESRRWVRRLAWLALGAVILQGVLGGITVLYRLPAPVSIGHACLAQLFFCLTLSLALFTSRSWDLAAGTFEDAHAPSFRYLCAATSGAIFLQLVFGAALRHGVLDFQWHAVWAFVVACLVGWVAVRAMTHLPEQKPLQRLALSLGILIIVQIALGVASLLLRQTQEAAAAVPTQMLVWITTLHVAAGALALGISWVLALLAFRRTWALRSLAPMHQRVEKSPA
jgi:cytochrome c oxidase assembly protein subunit 15